MSEEHLELLGGCSAPVGAHSLLVVRAGRYLCALNLAHVIEIMRPLPLEPMPGVPEMVLGLSLIRGVPVPVIALSALLDTPAPSAPTRFVTVRTANRTVALAVGAVLGIREVPAAIQQAMPPLLHSAQMSAVRTIGALDTELFLVLDAARVIPDDFRDSPAAEEC